MDDTGGWGGYSLTVIITALVARGNDIVGWVKGWKDGAREAVKSDATIARELRDELRKDIDDLRAQLLAERKSCDERIERQEARIANLEDLCVALASGRRLDANAQATLASIKAGETQPAPQPERAAL